MSSNPLRVSLENIIPLTEARDHFSQIVTEVQKDKLYVLTKGGKPAVAIIDVKYLEQITGGNVNPGHVETEIQKNPSKVGRVEMISHTEKPITPPTPAPIPTPMPTPPTPPPPPMSKPMSTPLVIPTPTASTPVPPPPISKPMPMPNPPTPPTAAPTPPPITLVSKPIESPTATKLSSLPPNSTPPPPPAPKPVPPLANPAATAQIETSFSASTPPNLAPLKPNDNPKPATMIDMHPMADIDDQEKDQDTATQSDNDRTEPGDKPNPAQYSATSANTEPDDMMID